VTIKYNGWVGDNPNEYTTEHKIHAKFESDFVKANIKEKEVAALVPAQPLPHGDIFDDYMAYLRHSNSLVEKTYQLDKAHAFDGAGTAAGKEFALERIAAGAAELRDLIYFAWTRCYAVTSFKVERLGVFHKCVLLEDIDILVCYRSVTLDWQVSRSIHQVNKNVFVVIFKDSFNNLAFAARIAKRKVITYCR